MELRHGGLVLDVPDDWSDQSTLLFVAPRPQLNLPSRNAAVMPAEVVSVRFAVASDARDALHDDAALLAQTDPQYAIVEEGEYEGRLGNGWRMVHTIHIEGTTLRQIAIGIVVGPVVVIASATAADAGFERVQARLEGILSSLRSARS